MRAHLGLPFFHHRVFPLYCLPLSPCHMQVQWLTSFLQQALNKLKGSPFVPVWMVFACHHSFLKISARHPALSSSVDLSLWPAVLPRESPCHLLLAACGGLDEVASQHQVWTPLSLCCGPQLFIFSVWWEGFVIDFHVWHPWWSENVPFHRVFALLCYCLVLCCQKALFILRKNHRIKFDKPVVPASLTDCSVCGFHRICVHLDKLSCGSPIKTDEIPSFLTLLFWELGLDPKRASFLVFCLQGMSLGDTGC